MNSIFKNVITVSASAMVSSLLVISCSQSSSEDNEKDTAQFQQDKVAVETTQSADADKVLAQDEDVHSTEIGSSPIRIAEKHLHGAANIAIVIDGKTMTVELESPVYNVLGFEHSAETEQQKSTLRKAQESLRDPKSLFRFNAAASCQPTGPSPIWNFGSDDLHEKDDAHDSHHVDTHKKHDTHDHNHTSKQASHADEEKHLHKDMLLTYNLVCDRPERLEYVDMKIFETFPGFTDINIVYLGLSSQAALTANRQNNRVELDGT